MLYILPDVYVLVRRIWYFFAQLHNMMSMCTDVEKNVVLYEYSRSGVQLCMVAHEESDTHTTTLYVCWTNKHIQVAKDRLTFSAQQLLLIMRRSHVSTAGRRYGVSKSNECL